MVLPFGNLHSAFAGGLATCPFPPWPKLAPANAPMPNRIRLQPTRRLFFTCPPRIPNSYSLDASAERFDTRLQCSLEDGVPASNFLPTARLRMYASKAMSAARAANQIAVIERTTQPAALPTLASRNGRKLKVVICA